MLTPYLKKLMCLDSLEVKEAEHALEVMLLGSSSHQTSAFLALLRAKGETANEILGMTKALKKQSKRVDVPFTVLDIVGTGGDGAHTLNISTGAALLASACGVPVAKHGNRSSSSKCGSADVLEALGVPLHQDPEQVLLSLKTAGFAFMFAPYFHPVLKTLAPIRKELGFATSINILAPLLNPASAEVVLLGVFSEHLVEPIAVALSQNGIKKGYVFHGSGLDELSPVGPARGFLIEGDRISAYTMDPKAYGYSIVSKEHLRGGNSAKHNADLLIEILKGKRGAAADAIVLNAAMGLFLYGSENTLETCLERADATLLSGEAFEHLQELVKL